MLESLSSPSSDVEEDINVRLSDINVQLHQIESIIYHKWQFQGTSLLQVDLLIIIIDKLF